MQRKKAFMRGNAHLDPAWVWSWQEGSCETKATIRSALDRMRELVDLLNNASVHYYQYSSPIMTDYEYDKRGYLVKEKTPSNTTIYTYDDNGNMLTIIYQGEVISSFTYDNIYKDRLNSFYNNEGYFTVE